MNGWIPLSHKDSKILWISKMKTQVVDNTRSFVAHTVEAVSANAFTGKPNRACDAIYAVEFQRCQVKTFSDFLYHMENPKNTNYYT